MIEMIEYTKVGDFFINTSKVVVFYAKVGHNFIFIGGTHPQKKGKYEQNLFVCEYLRFIATLYLCSSL